jgi:site-specific DNA-methyltransferase (adenine-specific)
MIELLNIDCMDYLATCENNAFELAIVDPPYGAVELMNTSGRAAKMCEEMKKWDKRPEREYFDELRRVSKNQIIWGAHYFLDKLPISSRWLCWDKGKLHHFPEFELAWMSLNKPSRMFRYHRISAYVHDMDTKIHPTQKPVKLYEWMLMNYAKEGDRILDTHLGSGSSAIACHNLGFDFVGCEIDRDYYNAALKRYRQHAAQLTIPVAY